MLLSITIDIVTLIFALVAVIMVSMVVFRTEKGLDRVFKYYLASMVTILISTAMILNTYLNIIPHKYTDSIFQASRVLAFIFFILGCQVMLMIINKSSKK